MFRSYIPEKPKEPEIVVSDDLDSEDIDIEKFDIDDSEESEQPEEEEIEHPEQPEEFDADSESSNDSVPGLMNREESDSSDDDEEPPGLTSRNPMESSDDEDDSSNDESDPHLSSPIDPIPKLVKNIHAPKYRRRPDYSDSSDDEQYQEQKRNSKIERKKAKKKRQEQRRKEAAEKERILEEEAAERKRFLEREKERKRKASLTITAFVRMVEARRRWERARCGFILVQGTVRGMRTRKENASVVKRITEFVRFRQMWHKCVKLVDGVEMDEPDWATLRDKQAYIRQQEMENDEQKDTDERLTNSMADAMNTLESRTVDDDIEDVNGLPTQRITRPRKSANGNRNGNSSDSVPITFKRIHLSDNVVKWLRNGDRKYIDFFIRRMKQLSGGERSRILAKKLKGSTTSKVPIYETYLEQKSGFRILWTEKDDYLLVWYVAKHKAVSRLMRLVDDSKNRSDRHRVSIEDIEEMKDAEATEGDDDEHEIFLDPLGNVPLKVYDVNTDDIDKIAAKDWTPSLHLTAEERDVVETLGTVLLLGRSGTGKTICICNRMEYDRQKFAMDENFSQLFVARSPRLCTYVKQNIGENCVSEFATFDRILEVLERELPKIESVRDDFPDSQQMRFSTFKQEVYNGDKGIDALIVWTNIRSFIKGSIEAIQNPGFVIPEESYLSQENFGKKRCRLSDEQRKIVYDVFLRYQQKAAELNTWDNCDRIIALIQRLLAAKTSDPDMFQRKDCWCKWSKIYVDEVQDYTQAEILLFFHLSGAGNLFLAGDPAQNVTKGVEFRFDEIRSVGYYIAGENRHLIPQKPKTVNVNFRSHAGVLNAAAAILSCMFGVFPDSAKQLGKDDGLFQGPRPGVFHRVQAETISALVHGKMRGTRVLTHDDNVEECMGKLGGYELVYGIRKTKGLEFKSVIVLDFFSSIPDELQKPWREMLLGRASHDFKLQYPEIEGQLKLLYTAVTRCIDRLFFAETASSIAGDAFVRWMTTKSVRRDEGGALPIATHNKIGDIENMTMTQDEVRVGYIYIYLSFWARLFSFFEF
jgi:hypothetical protein